MATNLGNGGAANSAMLAAIGRGLLLLALGFMGWQLQRFTEKVDTLVTQMAVLQSRFEGELAVRLWADRETAAKIGRLEIRSFGYSPDTPSGPIEVSPPRTQPPPGTSPSSPLR